MDLTDFATGDLAGQQGWTTNGIQPSIAIVHGTGAVSTAAGITVCTLELPLLPHQHIAIGINGTKATTGAGTNHSMSFYGPGQRYGVIINSDGTLTMVARTIQNLTDTWTAGSLHSLSLHFRDNVVDLYLNGVKVASDAPADSNGSPLSLNFNATDRWTLIDYFVEPI